MDSIEEKKNFLIDRVKAGVSVYSANKEWQQIEEVVNGTPSKGTGAPFVHYSDALDRYGQPHTPKEVVEFQIGLARQRGKTYAMIMALPSDKRFYIVTHSVWMQSVLTSAIVKLRPEIRGWNINYIVGKRQFDILRDPKWQGTSDPVYFDNAALDLYITEYVGYINGIARNGFTNTPDICGQGS